MARRRIRAVLLAVAALAIGFAHPAVANESPDDHGAATAPHHTGHPPLAVAPPAGSVWRSVTVDGVVRRYLLSVPDRRSGPFPLVIAFHGLRQTAPAFAVRTGLVPATRAAGQVLALPESSGPAFNDGRLGRNGPQDDAFAIALIQQLAGGKLIDPHRVVVTGFSNGAGMAMEVAGRHPTRVSALVAVAGDMIAGPAAPRPGGPVTAVLVHGTADRIQPWGGRPARGPLWPAYISVTATVDHWVRADRAGPVSTATFVGAHTVTVQTWRPGPSGAGVTFYAVSGLGHQWPLGTVGPGATGLDATSLVVAAAGAPTSAAHPAAGG